MRRRPELEFLPAVLEIERTPPSPAGRAVAWTIVVAFVATVVWACLGTIDVTAVARGRTIPGDYSKVIQPLESGIIRAIRVRDNQLVRAGAVLLELDPTAAQADQQRTVFEYRAAVVERARLQALLAGEPVLDPPPDADPHLTAIQNRILADQLAEHRGRREAARHLIAQRAAAVEATRANIERLDATLPMLTERAAAYRKLLDQEYVAKMQYLEMEQQRIDKAQELAGQRHKLAQEVAAVAEAETQAAVVEAEFTRARSAELAVTETRAQSLRQEMVKAGQRATIQKLRAPIDGIVQQLAVHTVGGVVTPAQHLMVVVPKDALLEVECWIENKDIGFVRAGQRAEVKVESFPYTRYGIIEATVVHVSPEAVPVDKVGLVYVARVALAQSTMQIDGGPVGLSPGMAVTVDIRTGARRLIELFLSPLLRVRAESLRER